MPAIFIAGSDTNVGKTVVTAGIAACLKRRQLSTVVYKPVQTGSLSPEDMDSVQALAGSDIPTVCPYVFAVPAAPYIADRLVNNGQLSIDIPFLLQKAKALQADYQWLLIEGAGGVRVPLAPAYENIDLMSDLALPVILVVRPDLGTINHTLLSVEALVRRDILVLGVVISAMPSTDALYHDPHAQALRTLPAILQEFLPVPVLAVLPKFELGLSDSSSPYIHTIQDFSQQQLDCFEPIISALLSTH